MELEDEREEEEIVERPSFSHQARATASVFIETGRGQTAEVQSGAPFVETLERIADEAHYGGYFRIFLNGEEVLEPYLADGVTLNPATPATIEPGMRIAISAYDKVG